jgi:hypothetical protein
LHKDVMVTAMGKGLTIFTFGYWGWGNETKLLLQATAEVERGRGFEPPMFVDVRISRSVRASGFCSSAFEELAGPERYSWMRGLGNRAVRDGVPNEITIDHPEAATQLLDLAIERAKMKQRLLVFCACDFPGPTANPMCHRRTVANLVLAEAARRHAPVDVVEWPGGEPRSIQLEVTHQELKKLGASSGRPLMPPWAIGEVAAVAAGSPVEARAGDDTWIFLAQPAKPRRGELVIPQLVRGFEDWEEAWREYSARLGLGVFRSTA